MSIIYKTTNIINNKIYISVHNNTNPKYLGSDEKLKRAIKKYGKENFIRETIEEFDTLEDSVSKGLKEKGEIRYGKDNIFGQVNWTGSEAGRANEYKFIDPDGNEYIVNGELENFCKRTIFHYQCFIIVTKQEINQPKEVKILVG